MRKKKKWKLIALVCCIGFTGCQPTPQETFIQRRQEMIREIEPVAEDELRNKEFPVHWKDTLEKEKNKIQVVMQADAGLEIPSISNVPVEEYGQRLITDRMLEHLVSYFAGDDRLYKKPPMTKKELERELEKVQLGEGEAGSPGSFRHVTDRTGKIEELIQEAPETVEKEYVPIAFDYPRRQEVTRVRKWQFYDEILTEKNSFSVLVERENGADPWIDVTNYDKKAGSSSKFHYTDCDSITEGELEETIETDQYLEADGEAASERYGDWIEEIRQQMGEPELSEQEAVRQAEKIMEDLQIRDLYLIRTEKTLCLPRSDSFWGPIGDFSQADRAWTLTFKRRVGNLTDSDMTGGFSYYQNPSRAYNPPFGEETLKITLSDQGIRAFSWDNLCEKIQTIAENVAMESFDSCCQKLLDYLYYDAAARAPKGVRYWYLIDRVELHINPVTAEGNPEHAYLVPVWEFYGRMTYNQDPTQEGVRFYQMTDLMINACDGGFVRLH